MEVGGEERREVASGSGQQLPSWVGESWRGADDDGEIKRLTALMTVMGRIGRLRRAHGWRRSWTFVHHLVVRCLSGEIKPLGSNSNSSDLTS